MTDAKPKWQSDEEAPNCAKCGKEFTFFFRRHHCRGCGKVMCGDCTQKKCKLPESFGYHGEERVCDACFEYVGVKQTLQDDNATVDYEEVKKKLFEDCRQVLEADEKEWKLLIVKEDVEVSTKIAKINGVESPFEAVRTRTIIQADFEKTKKMCFDPQLWKNWTADLKDFKLLQKISDNMEVWFEEYKLPVVEDRYVCTLKVKEDQSLFKIHHHSHATHSHSHEHASHSHSHEHEHEHSHEHSHEHKQQTFSLLACSVPHPQCPKVSGVRGKLNYSITHLRPIVRDGKEFTEFTAYGHFDPSGLLPPVLVNKLLTEAGHNIHLMALYIQNH